MRVGVLAGGPSSEREISLRSGRTVHNALVQGGIDAIFLDVYDDIRDIISKNKIDVVFIALHGRFGEDGTVQKILEENDIPYTGSDPSSSRIALDKIATKRVFEAKGIPTPRYIVLEKDAYDIESARKFGFPVVAKPQFEGSSFGLSVVKKESELQEALDKAFLYGPKILVEEYIDGRELTVGVLDDKPLPVIEIVPKNHVYDYRAKYDDPDTQYLIPAPIDPGSFERAKELGIAAHRSIGCRSFSRVDLMMKKSGDLFVLEVNTIPGMTERSLLPKAAAAIGLNFNRLCIKLIENALSVKKEIAVK
jgi:D-alanine-D-alanine ligase